MSDKLKSMFNDPQFAKLYKTGEKATGIWAGELVQRTKFADDLSRLDKLVILDNACGTGIITQKIMDLVDDKTAPKVHITGADYADAMVNAFKEKIEAEGWRNADAVVADAQV